MQLLKFLGAQDDDDGIHQAGILIGTSFWKDEIQIFGLSTSWRAITSQSPSILALSLDLLAGLNPLYAFSQLLIGALEENICKSVLG